MMGETAPGGAPVPGIEKRRAPVAGFNRNEDRALVRQEGGEIQVARVVEDGPCDVEGERLCLPIRREDRRERDAHLVPVQDVAVEEVPPVVSADDGVLERGAAAAGRLPRRQAGRKSKEMGWGEAAAETAGAADTMTAASAPSARRAEVKEEGEESRLQIRHAVAHHGI